MSSLNSRETQNLIAKLTAAGILPDVKSQSGTTTKSASGQKQKQQQQAAVKAGAGARQQQQQQQSQAGGSKAIGVVIGRPATAQPAAAAAKPLPRGDQQEERKPPAGATHTTDRSTRSTAAAEAYEPFDWEKAAATSAAGSADVDSKRDPATSHYNVIKKEAAVTHIRNPKKEPGASRYASSSSYDHSDRDVVSTSPAIAAEPQKRLHFNSIIYIMECGTKLGLSSELVATASCVYHAFYEQCTAIDGEITGNYDPYLISATSLYIATKVGEELSVKLRDIVNVCYRTVHGERHRPLEIGAEYWALRDSIVHCELLVLRMLQFKTDFPLAHRYLLHYLKSLRDWLGEGPWSELQAQLTGTAWSFLRDAYLEPQLALEVKARHLATAVLYLTVSAYGLTVPHDQGAERCWWQVFGSDLSRKQLITICLYLMRVYRQELQVGAKLSVAM